MLKEQRGQEFNIKRAEKRVLDAKESARRKSKRFFKLQMSAIAHRQAQCVAVSCISITVTSQSVPCLFRAGISSGHSQHCEQISLECIVSAILPAGPFWPLEAP